MKWSATTRRLLAVAGFILLVGGIYWLQRDAVTFSQIVQRETRLRSWIDANPVTAFAGGFFLYILLSLLPGTPGKAVVFGWLYGFWQAVIIVDCGLTIAAVITFLVSRYVFQDIIRSRWEGLYGWMNSALERDGAFYLLTLRMMHVPYTLINYAAGVTGVRLRTFWWTTQVGLVPGIMVWVLLGARLPSLGELQKHGLWSLLDPLLLTALLLIAISPFAIRWVLLRGQGRRRSRQRAGQEAYPLRKGKHVAVHSSSDTEN